MPPEPYLDKPTKVSDSVFQEPIPADLPRRQFDRKLLEGYDAAREHIRSISSRMTRIEVISETIQRDLSRLEQRQSEGLTHAEKTADSMAEISHKLRVHTEMEEYQWTVVNKSNDALALVTAALSEHLKEAGAMTTRLDWIERLLLVLYGCGGSIGIALLTQYVIALSAGHAP